MSDRTNQKSGASFRRCVCLAVAFFGWAGSLTLLVTTALGQRSTSVEFPSSLRESNDVIDDEFSRFDNYAKQHELQWHDLSQSTLDLDLPRETQPRSATVFASTRDSSSGVLKKLNPEELLRPAAVDPASVSAIESAVSSTSKPDTRPASFNFPVGSQRDFVDNYLNQGARGSTRRYGWAALARFYYDNDQRLEFTGQEDTFGVEGIVAGGIRDHYGTLRYGVFGELFLNQPFDRNQLVDYPVRRSYLGNFDIDPIEISQLVFEFQFANWTLQAGKMVTPFGRFYYPLYTNSLEDAPFIRTESILTRETGVNLEWRPGYWVMSTAITNGGVNRDTNSSKAIISRIGIETSRYALGASVKRQDGIGSESQKVYNNHYGIDAIWRMGRFSLSGEVIYDQYGFRRPGFDPLDITWGRSIYNRDLNKGYKQPITGWGYYANLNYDSPGWTFNLNYGEFSPEFIGDVIHDRITRRLIGKAVKHFGSKFDVYSQLLLENDLLQGEGGRKRSGFHMIVGCQMVF